MGLAIMGTGIATGEGRARVAATAAVSSPLLEDANMDGARGVIINVTGGPDLTLSEVSEASDIVYNAAHEDANIIFGAVVDPAMEGKVKITVIATGFDRAKAAVSPASQATTVTPADMSHYLQPRVPQEERERQVVNGGGHIIVPRRRTLDLGGAVARLAPPADAGEEESTIDIPPFLRHRQG
jgi:cell division protein FtsZ